MTPDGKELTPGPQVIDHPWVGILGHPDDDECAECGQPEHRHEETTR